MVTIGIALPNKQKSYHYQPTDDSWLQINEHGSWHVLASSSLAEEGVERVITTSDGLVRWHLAIWLDTVLEAVQLPAGITDLGTSLSDVDGDTLTLQINRKARVNI